MDGLKIYLGNTTGNYSKYLMIFLTFLLACRERRKGGKEVITYFGDKKTISERYYIIRDTLKDGLYINYFKSGIVSCLRNYKYGNLEEKVLYYYDDRILNSIQTMTKNRLDGMSTEYFHSGLLKTVGRYADNHRILSHLEYFSNGNVLSYSFYDLEGRLKYKAVYDNEGIVEQEEGELESYYYYTPNPHDGPLLALRDSLIVNMITPLPPHLRIYITKYVSDDNEARLNPLDIKLDRFNASRFVIEFDRPGFHHWMIVRQTENLIRFTKGESWELAKIEAH